MGLSYILGCVFFFFFQLESDSRPPAAALMVTLHFSPFGRPSQPNRAVSLSPWQTPPEPRPCILAEMAPANEIVALLLEGQHSLSCQCLAPASLNCTSFPGRLLLCAAAPPPPPFSRVRFCVKITG